MHMRRVFYKLLFAASVLLTAVSVKYAYDFRGYFAIGGEYAVLALPFVVAAFDCMLGGGDGRDR